MGWPPSRPCAVACLSSQTCASLSPQEAGLKEGDYIISVNGKDCKWSKHAEVVQLLKSTGEEGVEIIVITLQGSEGPKPVSRITSLRWEAAEEVPLFLLSGWRCRAEARHHVCSPGDALASPFSILLPKQADKKAAAMSSGSGMLKSNKENNRKSLMNNKSTSTLLVWSKKSKRSKKSTYGVPFTTVGDNEAMY